MENYGYGVYFFVLSLVVLSVNTIIVKLVKSGIKIYPNPSFGKFNVEFESLNGYKDLIIYNLESQKVLQKLLSKSIENIDLSTFGEGMYMISIQRNNEIIHSKIIVRN